MTTAATSNTPWPTVKLGDVCTRIKRLKDVACSNFSYIDISSINRETKRIAEMTEYERNQAPGRAQQVVERGDVLVSTVRPNLNAVAIVEGKSAIQRIASTGFCVLRPCEDVSAQFIYYFTQTEYFISRLVAVSEKASYPSVTDSVVKDVSIPLPPLEVQREIVAKVEKGLAEADALTAHFKRMATLADETFKAELDETFQSLSAPTVPSVRLGELGEMKRGSGIKKVEVLPKGRPCVRYGEIYTSFNYILDSPKSFVCDEIYEKSLHVKSGDLIFTLTGENREEIGKALAYLEEEEVAAGGDLAVWSNHGCNPKYLAYLMYSSPLIHEKAMASNGQIIVHLSVKKMQQISIPLPPLDEQQAIVAKLEAVKARCERLKAEAERGVKAAEALRKAVLAEAFEQ